MGEKWEYLVYDEPGNATPESTQHTLNTLGLEGWILVCVYAKRHYLTRRLG